MHSMDSVKRRIITSMVAILLLVITLFGITYAYFIAKVKGNEEDTSINIKAGKLELTYIDGEDTINVENIQPGVLLESKTFSVKNTGTEDIKSYEVYLIDVINQLNYPEHLRYELTCVSDLNVCKGNTTTFPQNDSKLITNSILEGETQTYTLVLRYLETNTDQSKDMNKQVSARVSIKDEIPEYQEQ